MENNIPPNNIPPNNRSPNRNNGNNKKTYPNYYQGTNLSENEKKSLLRQYQTNCSSSLLPKYNAIISVQEKNTDLKNSIAADWKNVRNSVREECARVNKYSKWMENGAIGNAPEEADYTYLMSASKWPEDYEKNYAKFKANISKEKLENAIQNKTTNATNGGKCCKCPPEAIESLRPPNIPNGISKGSLPPNTRRNRRRRNTRRRRVSRRNARR
jgi:hypothetical protein